MQAMQRHVTLVPADPPRRSQLAFWHPDEPDPDAHDVVVVAVPGPEGIRPTAVDARVIALPEVLDHLARVGIDDPGASPSARAWAAVARSALDLVARERLEPSITPEGHDTWNLTPLDDADRAALDALADWLPVTAHCLALTDGSDGPVRVMDPAEAITEFRLAVADAMVRTAAAPDLAGQPWASQDPVDISPLRSHLRALQHEPGTVAVLRLLEPSITPASDRAPFRLQLWVRTEEDPSSAVPATEVWSGTAALPPGAESDVLLALRRGAAVWEPLQRLLDDATPDVLDLTDEETASLFGVVSDTPGALRAAGIELFVPATMAKRPRPIVQVGSASTAGPTEHRTEGRFDLQSLYELTWRASLDGEPLTDEELSELASSSRPLVRLRDQWVVVDPELARRLGRSSTVTAAQAVTAALSGTLDLAEDDELAEVHLSGAVRDLVDRLATARSPRALDAPHSMQVTLRPYQRRGLAWLAEMADLGLGGVLADDMGLGKTVQLIALHELRRETSDRPTLVVCPATLIGNWQRELERFAPHTPVRRYHGTQRHLRDLAPGEVVLTTYGIVRRDVEALASVDWDLVVADEAQQIKNPSSSTAAAMRALPHRARFALTGTPVENRLEDLWALLDWTTPGLLGSAESFRRSIAIPIERDRDATRTRRFADLISPFLLRRRKDDPTIVPELPPKTETDHPVPLTEEQASLYRANVEEIMALIDAADGIQRRGLVLKLLTTLKQICNHPAQFLKQPGPLAGRSGKLDAFSDLASAIVDAGDSMLVFTQYVEMGHLLTARLDELGVSSRFLHGSTSLAERSSMVDAFQDGAFPVLVLSLRAGGTGLNLTAATHVIHYDRWWNPAVEDQASDRAWRIGQDRPVQVHRLISEGTVEDRIATILRDKRQLADSVTGGGEAWITELDDEQLAELVQLAAPT